MCYRTGIDDIKISRLPLTDLAETVAGQVGKHLLGLILIETAAEIVQTADVFAVIGTSLAVYPAAGLVDYVPEGVPIYLVDPNDITVPRNRGVEIIREKASIGLPILKEKLLGKTP